ncbi:rhodanese-like domain-containing protein [Ammoniphilus sp. CFH 90114]|uniref:rhodanese-like domain-containing protein n=1 Tax=Ammoniphilus sp. CFH 90114 TaxID=2493665 RepID=UPI00100EAB12|nr:rhodanese-like domain-containing protein [Ammoniphilus sp. CFH 90114]RXT13862.1 rhodanese-like domain-containing protein [Ammoniphilus sp. CFH 90114]
MQNQHISAYDFVERLTKGELDNSYIIDVREPYEWEQYHLDQAVLVPMNIVPSKWSEFPSDKDIYLVCAHGVRSWHVMNYLFENGLSRVINVEGGMAEIYPMLQKGK